MGGCNAASTSDRSASALSRLFVEKHVSVYLAPRSSERHRPPDPIQRCSPRALSSAGFSLTQRYSGTALCTIHSSQTRRLRASGQTQSDVSLSEAPAAASEPETSGIARVMGFSRFAEIIVLVNAYVIMDGFVYCCAMAANMFSASFSFTCPDSEEPRFKVRCSLNFSDILYVVSSDNNVSLLHSCRPRLHVRQFQRLATMRLSCFSCKSFAQDLVPRAGRQPVSKDEIDDR